MLTSQLQKGFTLIEALIAMLVLTVGVIGLYGMQVRSIDGNTKAMSTTGASNRNGDQMESIIAMAYNSATLNDTDGDGTNVDADGDGIDDNGNEFGLDDVITGIAAPASADGFFITADNRYTVYWNVAVDHPLPNVKTIRIHVQDNLQISPIPVTYTYFKADII